MATTPAIVADERAVEVTKLTFSYDPKKAPVLRDVSFSLPPGMCIEETTGLYNALWAYLHCFRYEDHADTSVYLVLVFKCECCPLLGPCSRCTYPHATPSYLQVHDCC
jgi:hypothetical protein